MNINRITTLGLISSLLLLGGCSSDPTPEKDYLALYEQANKSGDDQQALTYLQLAAENNNSNAMSRLGEAYLHGRYGLNDTAKGLTYIQEAAAMGEARAMTSLGIAYLYGQGVEQDYQQALDWLNKASTAGDMKSPRYIGLAYQNGWGTDIDFTQAAIQYQKAADKGDITSQYYLGKLYETGQGVEQDYRKAFDLYQQSAARGDIVCLPAILALGNVYENGLGVKKDISQALVWYNKAADLGDDGAKIKVGQYQYPEIPQIMNVTALVNILGDGQKVAGAAIEYTRNIDASSLILSDYQVDGRETTAVYVSNKAQLGSATASGSYAIVELKTEIDPNSSQMGGGPSKEQNSGPEDEEGAGSPGPGGPQLGQISDKSAEPVVLNTSVVQSGDVTLESGEKVPANTTKLDSNQTLNPAITGFQQLVFHDDEFNKDLMYNLYIPKNYDPSKSYPLVLFMHDAGVVSNNPIETLTQGLGAVIWASDRDQAQHESFVLAPQYNAIMADDNSQTSVDMDVTVNLINQLLTQYSIDKDRLYNTGQSMGGMTSIAMNIKYPDLFAASLLVACQWNPELVAPMANKPLWIVVSAGDNKANPGMDAITDVLAENGATVTKATWNAESSASDQDQQVKQMLGQHSQINYTVFEGGSHRYTWQYAYSIDGIRDWLFAHSKK